MLDEDMDQTDLKSQNIPVLLPRPVRLVDCCPSLFADAG